MGLIDVLPEVLKSAETRYEEALSVQLDGHEYVEIMNVAEECSDGEIIQADNAEFLISRITDGSLSGAVDLIYCDPPFFTRGGFDATINIPYKGKNKKFHIVAYDDHSAVRINSYLEELAFRLMLMRDALSETGSIFIHLDRHAVHAVKLIMDEIFGEKNFINEIIWTYKSGGSTNRRFAHKHDTILFYSRTDRYKFNPTKEKSYNRKLKKYSFAGVAEYKDDIGWYTMVNSKDVWHIDMVGRSSKERLNYATQKPVALIERIIEACSDEGDLCADFFCGSGTLADAACKMKRKFICVDSGNLAVSNTVKRLLIRGGDFRLNKFGSVVNVDDSCLPKIKAQRNGNNIEITEYIADRDHIRVKAGEIGIAEYLLKNDPMVFIDFWCIGKLDENDCFYPLKTVFENGKINICTDDENAVIVFDIFGNILISKFEK